jgi:hypothetical protein
MAETLLVSVGKTFKYSHEIEVRDELGKDFQCGVESA